MSGLTDSIARFIAAIDWGDLPSVAIEKSNRVLTDTFAVILAGSGSEVAEPLAKYARHAGHAGEHPVLGTRIRTSAEIAALLNGTFGHGLDFDDVLTMMPGHPSAIIVAAVLASIGDRTISGADSLLAHIVGIEVGAKIGLAITHGHYERGFHGTGSLGIFSAVSALAKLHQLDPATTRIALGIASSMASGVRRNFGTMTKPFHTGWAARSALTAIELARCGFTAAPDALEASAGFLPRMVLRPQIRRRLSISLATPERSSHLVSGSKNGRATTAPSARCSACSSSGENSVSPRTPYARSNAACRRAE